MMTSSDLPRPGLGFYAPFLVCDIPEDFGQAHRELNSSATRISALQRKI
jgi:hypothetical protein